MSILILCCLSSLNVILSNGVHVYNIENYGAQPSIEEPDFSVAELNSKSIEEAFRLAQQDVVGVRIVYVPRQRFYFSPVRVVGVFNITFLIDGIG